MLEQFVHKHDIRLLVLYNIKVIFICQVASFLLCQVVALSLSQLTIINFTILTSISRDGTMISLLFFFFFGEGCNRCSSPLIIALYYQTKTPINFWYRRGMKPRSLIQLSEALPAELTRTHMISLLKALN